MGHDGAARSLEANGAGRLCVLLDWYREVGVSHVLDEAPIDWRLRGDHGPGNTFRLAEQSEFGEATSTTTPEMRSATGPEVTYDPPMTQPDSPKAQPKSSARRFPNKPPDEAATVAQRQAASAATLDQLRHLLEDFDGCALKATAKNLSFYRGAPRSRLMVIGEAPGRDEDMAGEPFVGQAGRLLDRMLAAIGESAATSHITNMVYWRPPGNRPPTVAEFQICRPFMMRQIELVAPEILLLLGGGVAKQMLDTSDGIMKVRGTWRAMSTGRTEVRTMVTLHPTYLLQTPLAKRQVWNDLLAVQSALPSING